MEEDERMAKSRIKAEFKGEFWVTPHEYYANKNIVV